MIETPIQPFMEVTNKELGLIKVNFHLGQQRAWESKKRFPVMLAGLQSGKTCIMPLWLEREINKDIKDGKTRMDYLVATATYDILNLKLLPEFRRLFEEIRGVAEWEAGRKTLQYKNYPIRIIFRSADNPEAIESATAGAAVLDEAGQDQFRANTWDAVQGRVSLNRGRILIGTSLYNFGWLKTQIYDKWKQGDPDIEVIQFDSTMNPAFPKDEYERQKRLMPGWKFAMRYQGRYEKPAGMVYDCFDSNTHVKNLDISKDWPIYTGHDFGYVNPAAVFVTTLPSGERVVYDEYLPGQGYGPREHIAKWKEMKQGRTLLLSSGGSHQEEEIRIAYSVQGWPINEPLIRGVEAGIQKVYSLLKDNQLYITPNCIRLIDEFGRYSYKLDENNEPTDEIENKASFHLLDALRGICSNFNYNSFTSHYRSPMANLVLPRL